MLPFPHFLELHYKLRILMLRADPGEKDRAARLESQNWNREQKV